MRWDVDWGIVQAGGPTSYNWAGVDRVAATAAKFGIKSLPIITYAPQWAFDPVFKCASYQHCEPLDPNAFARFAGEVVKRYKDSIHVWEIWNEQNLSVFWAPRSNCQKYTALLKASYTAIKQVDPSATVLAGGFAPAATDGTNMAPIDYLKCIYAEGGKGYFDAVAHHPYTYPYSPSTPGGNAWAQMSLTSTSLRSLMVLNGDGDKKIWMTEFGAPTGGPDSRWYVSEAMQASIIKEALQLHATYPWAGPIFIYSLRDSGTTSETNENFFGIMRRDWTRKPAYDTMKTIISSGI